jgi:hypothetical protein
MIGATNGEIERLVKVRMARREIVRSSDEPQLWLILNEAVIRRVVGSGSVMRERLERLIEASRAPNLTLQVIPFNAGAHAAMDGSFQLLGFPEPSDPRAGWSKSSFSNGQGGACAATAMSLPTCTIEGEVTIGFGPAITSWCHGPDPMSARLCHQKLSELSGPSAASAISVVVRIPTRSVTAVIAIGA